jgi:hypothetical protein
MLKKLLALVPAILLRAAIAAAQDKSSDLAIVVNASCSLDNVSSAELAKIFKAEKSKTPEGAKFLIGVRETGSAERKAALEAIYHMTDAEYEKFFLQATFAGTVTAAPKVLAGAGAARLFVAGSPGAICYLRASEADSSVKVVKVDGKAPGDPGYPIKIK